ncbi:cytidine deaminase [Pseudooceanicola antarcticus]|nr:cytidine deaminase [Pseudooceanicola antarcticus]SNY48768.1 cytidine deaminase [Pseudooceanicola antarcticus]
MDLLQAATEAYEKAYAPYSKFKVGAAIRTPSGEVFQGVNVENVAYPEGTCAEAGAIAAMILGGQSEVSEVAVIADATAPVPPCGGCRQKLSEFGKGDVKVSMYTLSGEKLEMTLAELLPGKFTAEHMKD